MTVICDITNCGYNTDGICCQKCYVSLRGGQCTYLQRYPNSFTQRWDVQELAEYVPQYSVIQDDSTEADINQPEHSEELSNPEDTPVPQKRKRGRPKKNTSSNVDNISKS